MAVCNWLEEYQRKEYEKLHAKCCAMTHEERLASAAKSNKMGGAIIICGLACFIGIAVGMWSERGAAGIGIAFGCSLGVVSGSWGLFAQAKSIKKIDAELSNATDAAP